MSIFKSGLWFAPPPSVRPSMGRYNNPEKTFCGNRSRPLRYVKGLIEQLRYTSLCNVCSVAIAKTQQEYALAQAR
jgi:hypothetical protein